jgi:hypothetical protein
MIKKSYLRQRDVDCKEKLRFVQYRQMYSCVFVENYNSNKPKSFCDCSYEYDCQDFEDFWFSLPIDDDYSSMSEYCENKMIELTNTRWNCVYSGKDGSDGIVNGDETFCECTRIKKCTNHKIIQIFN